MLVYLVGWRGTSSKTLEAIKHHLLSFPVLLSTKGVFVSIHRQGKLAGCIGTFGGTKSNLIERIMLYALRSTFEDHRFSGHQLRTVLISEAWMTDNWTFTTTFLDTPFQVPTDEFWLHFIPGTHGISLTYKNKSATFLPTVLSSLFLVAG